MNNPNQTQCEWLLCGKEKTNTFHTSFLHYTGWENLISNVSTKFRIPTICFELKTENKIMVLVITLPSYHTVVFFITKKVSLQDLERYLDLRDTIQLDEFKILTCEKFDPYSNRLLLTGFC